MSAIYIINIYYPCFLVICTYWCAPSHASVSKTCKHILCMSCVCKMGKSSIYGCLSGMIAKSIKLSTLINAVRCIMHLDTAPTAITSCFAAITTNLHRYWAYLTFCFGRLNRQVTCILEWLLLCWRSSCSRGTRHTREAPPNLDGTYTINVALSMLRVEQWFNIDAKSVPGKLLYIGHASFWDIETSDKNMFETFSMVIG